MLVSLTGGTGTTSETGGTTSYTVKLTGATSATGSVSFTVGGLDGTEGALTGSYVLNEQNNWTSVISVAGLNDRDDDGNIAYQLNFATDLFGQQQVTVINADNDVTPTSIGARSGNYKGAPSVTGTIAGLASDGGDVVSIKEGIAKTGGYAAVEWRWTFSNLTAGDYKLHLDAASDGEAMQFDFTTNGGTSWTKLQAGTAIAGDLDVVGIATSLMVRLVDLDRAGDTTKSTFTIDMLTLEKAAAPAGASFIDSVEHAEWYI